MEKSPRLRIEEWLENHPEAAIDIALAAVTGLYIDGDRNILPEDEDFPSGSDYIEDMVSAFEAAGVMDLIEELRNE